jgi:hypothetical protein
LTVLGKWLLYSVPICQGFDLISILGGVYPGDLDVLRGSALSGELRRPVKLRFLVNDRPTRYKHNHVKLGLNQEGANGKIEKWVKYG